MQLSKKLQLHFFSSVKKCGRYLSEKARRFIQQALEDDEYANEILTAGHLIEGKIKKAKGW